VTRLITTASAAAATALLRVDHRPELAAGKKPRHAGRLEPIEQRFERRRLVREEVPADVHLAAGARQRDHVVEHDVEGAAAVAVHTHPVMRFPVAVEGDLEAAGGERL